MDFTATDTSFVSQSINAGLRRNTTWVTPAMAKHRIGHYTRSELVPPQWLLERHRQHWPADWFAGYVLGMIMAFQALKEAGGTPKVQDLSGGISTALWHTFLGLAVAIPALVTFGFYRTRIDKITSKAALLSEELLESLRPEEKKTSVNVGGEMAKPAPCAAAAPAMGNSLRFNSPMCLWMNSVSRSSSLAA